MRQLWAATLVAVTLACGAAGARWAAADEGTLPATRPIQYMWGKQPVIVMGFVDHQGQFDLATRGGNIPLMQYLEELGLSKADPAKCGVRVIFGVVSNDKKKAGATTRPAGEVVYRLSALMAGDVPDLELRGGELVIVQEAQELEHAYIVGGSGLTRRGIYSLSERRITLKQAVVSAGLPSDWSRLSVEHVRRGKDGGPEQRTRCSLADLMEGRAEDIAITAGDVIIVGTPGDAK